MSNKIRIKVTKILNRDFDVDTIESLLIGIREDLSDELEDLKEICDLVAHSSRNQGIIYNQLRCHSLGISLELMGQKEFDRDLLPPIFKEYILSKFDCYDFSILKEEFNISKNKNQARKELAGAFISNEFVTNTLKILSSASKQIVDIIMHLASSKHQFDYIFSGECLFYQLLNYLLTKGYLKCEKEFISRREEILICLLLILHDSSYKLNNVHSVLAFITIDPISKLLIIRANILYKEIANKKDITFSLPLIKTDLKSIEWCMSNLLKLLQMENGHALLVGRCLNANEQFKLCLI